MKLHYPPDNRHDVQLLSNYCGDVHTVLVRFPGGSVTATGRVYIQIGKDDYDNPDQVAVGFDGSAPPFILLPLFAKCWRCPCGSDVLVVDVREQILHDLSQALGGGPQTPFAKSAFIATCWEKMKRAGE